MSPEKMRRPIGCCLVGFCVLAFTGLAAAADDSGLDPSQPPDRLKKKNKPMRDKKVKPMKDGDTKPPVPDPDKPVRPRIDDGAKKPAPRKSAEDERKEIVERILKNLEKAEAKLAKNDPGKTTRSIQRDIVKDLDKLIEQTRNQPPPQGGGSSSRSRRRKSQQKSSSSKEPNGSNKTNNGAKGNNPNEKEPKSGDKKGSGDVNHAGANSGQSAKKNQNKLHDLFKDVWGHLPETLRQEMDAYSRAKFVPDYELALKQYYRRLSEQGRKK